MIETTEMKDLKKKDMKMCVVSWIVILIGMILALFVPIVGWVVGLIICFIGLTMKRYGRTHYHGPYRYLKEKAEKNERQK